MTGIVSNITSESTRHANGSYDAYVAMINADGSLGWTSYLGGTGWDGGQAIAIDGEGNAWVAGRSSSPTFTSGGSAIGGYSGYNDIFVAKIKTDVAMPASVSIMAHTATVLEGNAVTYTVTRTGGDQTQGLTVYLNQPTGSATAVDDYGTVPTSVAISANQSSATFSVNTIDDIEVEPTEAIVLTLTSNSAYAVSGTDGSANSEIIDNDVNIVLEQKDALIGFQEEFLITTADYYGVAKAATINVESLDTAVIGVLDAQIQTDATGQGAVNLIGYIEGSATLVLAQRQPNGMAGAQKVATTQAVAGRIVVSKIDAGDIDAHETAVKLATALKELAPKFEYEVVRVNDTIYQVNMTGNDEALNQSKPTAAVQQQLEQVVNLWAGANPPVQKNNLEPYNSGFADAIQGLPQEGRGTWVSHNLVKSAMTKGIVVRGTQGPTQTLLAPKQILWKPDETLPYGGTPAIMIGHEMFHILTNKGGEILPHRQVVAYENMLRYEHKMPMRQKYNDESFWIAGDNGGYVPLILIK